MLFLLFPVVLAQEPINPDLRLQVQEDTYVHILQRIQSNKAGNMAEVVVHNCNCDFEDKYRSVYIPNKVTRISPVQLDSDSWILRFFFTVDAYHLDVTASDGYLDIWVQEDTAIERLDYESPYSIKEFLVATEDEKDQLYPPDINILFMNGNAISMPLNFDSHFFTLCSPKEDLKELSVADLKNYYTEMKESAQFTKWGDALYALGWNYYQKGLFDEADYYFEKHQNRIGSTSPRCRAIVDTHLAMRSRTWTDYQKGVQSAFSFGADDLQTLGALAYLSHETGYPSRKKVAQTLRAWTAEPNHLLLAAELFQMSGYFHESTEILEDLYSKGVFLDEPEKDQRVALRYGDALLVEGRFDDAKKVWRSIPQELSMMRHLLSMLNESIETKSVWPHMIPFLYRIADNYSSEIDARVEAMYLIAQINTMLDSRVQAMRAWKKMLKDFPEQGARSDAGSNLWALYYLEVMALQEEKRWGAIIELHEEIWDDEILIYALDPKVFQHVIDAYRFFGFEDEAIALTGKLRPQLIPYLTEEEHAQSLLTTAKIYKSKINGQDEGLATLDSIETKNVSAKTKNEIELLRAQFFMDKKEYDDAIKVLRRLKRSRQFRVKAQYLMGASFAAKEDCAAAMKEVGTSILSKSEIDDVFSLLHLYDFADCAAKQGQKKSAVAFLEYGKTQEITAKERALLNYLIADYDGGVYTPPPGSEEETYLWNRLIKEKVDNEAFQTEYEQWKQDSK